MDEKDKVQSEPKLTHKKIGAIIFPLAMAVFITLYIGNGLAQSLTEARDENSALVEISNIALNEFAATLEMQELDFYSLLPGDYSGEDITFVVANTGSSDLYTLTYPYFLHGQDKDTIKYAKSETGYNYIVFRDNPKDIDYQGRVYPKGAYNVTIYLTNGQ